MKRILTGFCFGTMALFASCSKQLDINDDPNRATSATPELILPTALTVTAGNLSAYNSYGSQQVGYSANAGGYGGFGSSITYNYTNDYSGLWGATFDNLQDYQAIINYTEDKKPAYGFFNAAARIMKSYNFQLLVDAYNDVPYSQALLGSGNLTPGYDDAKSVYEALAADIDVAIADIHATEASSEIVNELGKSDVMFEGDMEQWLKFANTLKLRLIIRASGKANFANTNFDAAGFLTEDAMVNPGYKRDNGRQNPLWNTWAWGATGSAANKAWMPNTFIFSFYNGTKLDDPGRGEAIYLDFPETGTNRLGVESNDIESSPTGSFWFSSHDRNGAANGNNVGVLKGPDAGMPLLLAAESYFLQAEGVVRGIISGDDKALFNDGIEASFHYIYMLPSGSVSGDPTADAAQYLADNTSSPLVNYDLANTNEKKIEAIITQKYIALNFTHGHEAWNEYRRTHYPSITPGDGTQTFASAVSESTRPDKLPTRILYPPQEGAYNPENVPTGISPFNSLIFWAL